MKKYMKPTIEVVLMTSQVIMQAGSNTREVVYDPNENPVDAQNIDSRRGRDIWEDEEEEDF